MFTINEIEDAILAAIRGDAGLAAVCKTIEPFAGDLETLAAKIDRLIDPLPAVWTVYRGSLFTESANRSYDDEMSFAVLVAAKSLRGRDAAKKEAYEILELLKSLLVDNNLGLDIDPLEPVSIELVAISDRWAIYGFILKTYFSMD